MNVMKYRLYDKCMKHATVRVKKVNYVWSVNSK